MTKSNFILIKPKDLSNADRVAKAIAICKGVSRVFVTSGDYGFVVSVNKEDKSGKVSAAVKRAMGNPRTKVIHGHYVYACRARS